MNFEIEWSPGAAKDLSKLPKQLIKRVKNKLEEVKKYPFRYLEYYEGKYYKLRIGDYRALIDVDFNRNILLIQVFDKRGRIYK